MRLFIGSTNLGKVEDWRQYFPDWEILSYKDLEIGKMEVEEGITSLEDNARRKASAWAQASGELTLSDDTGFFINALGGLPGVSVKRWGGRLEKEMNGEELMEFMRREIDGLDDLSCYFESVYAVADPAGNMEVFSERLDGRLDPSLFRKDLQKEFRLGTVFRAEGFDDKIWREMTVEERKKADRRVIEGIEKIAKSFCR